MNVRCDNVEVNGEVVVTVAGALDLATVPTFRDHLTRTVVDHPGTIITIDLAEVSSLDDVALGILLGAAGRARERAGDLRIVCTNPRMVSFLQQTGTDRAIDVAERF